MTGPSGSNLTSQTVAALLIRLLGVVMLVLGVLSFIGTIISYAYLPNSVALHDTYLVAGNALPDVIVILSGALFLFFSKPLGRLLSRGLP
jgi:hypothetical protein